MECWRKNNEKHKNRIEFDANRELDCVRKRRRREFLSLRPLGRAGGPPRSSIRYVSWWNISKKLLKVQHFGSIQHEKKKNFEIFDNYFTKK